MADDLVTVAEAQDYLDLAGSKKDKTLVAVIRRWSAIIERHLDRTDALIIDTDVTEWHPKEPGQIIGSELHLIDWPVQSVTSVHEDPELVYGADTLLTEGIAGDYIIESSNGHGKLIRIDNKFPTHWDNNYRAIQVIYKGAYADIASVPQDIKDIVLRGVGLEYRELIRQQQGVSSMSDATGNVTRFFHARLTDDMKRELGNYRRVEYSVRTGTRAV